MTERERGRGQYGEREGETPRAIRGGEGARERGWRQTDRHEYRETDRQTDRHEYRQTDRYEYTETERQTDRQTDMNTERQTDRQTDRQI